MLLQFLFQYFRQNDVKNDATSFLVKLGVDCFSKALIVAFVCLLLSQSG